MNAARSSRVRCLSARGFHQMRYQEWGDPRNPQVLLCVHSLTRLGSDFRHLAEALCGEYRVVCPDVVGRGESDWLPDPALYGTAQYAMDMVALLARLDVDRVDYLGTSMGGLIGLALAGRPHSPIRRLIINDIGPHMAPAAVERIARYASAGGRFADLEQAIAYVRSIASGFGLKTAEQWRELTESAVRFDGEQWVFRYDPAVGASLEPLKIPERAAQAERELWRLYEAVEGPALVIRGTESDVLSRDVAQRMTQCGPRATLAEVPGVGHAPPFFDDDQISIVRDFLRLQPRT
jgi:pimeloyl-ACP methyl ester carboxylesterase